eukprot:3542355-Amphidinium_carterae.1
MARRMQTLWPRSRVVVSSYRGQDGLRSRRWPSTSSCVLLSAAIEIIMHVTHTHFVCGCGPKLAYSSLDESDSASQNGSPRMTSSATL